MTDNIHVLSTNESTEVQLDKVHVAKRCACRGWIVAQEGVAKSIGDAVVRHQLDEPHKSFDVEQWREANTTTAPVQTTLRKIA